jgi:hypothetical protein
MFVVNRYFGKMVVKLAVTVIGPLIVKVRNRKEITFTTTTVM